MSVVVTGIGTISAAGAGLEALAVALRTGRPSLTAVDRSQGFHREGAARSAALVPEAATSPWVPPAQARRMSPPSRLAVAAARMALAEAGWSPAEIAGPETAISLGTAFGCTSFTAKLLSQMAEGGPEAISPFLFMETVANAHAGQVALALGARGPNYTLTQREASGLLAVLRGRELLSAGRARVVLAGVVDEMAPLLHAVLDRFDALARGATADEPERALPYDRRRSGFLAAEGSTVLVLEEEPRARARGARILARLGAGARAFDPSATTADWGSGGVELAAVLAAELERQGQAPRGLHGIVAGASGSPRGDRLEAELLRALFRDEPPPLVAPKHTTGEYGGASLAAAFVALAGGEITPHADHLPDPELALVPGAHLRGAERILLSSLAAGGAAATLVLERVSDG